MPCTTCRHFNVDEAGFRWCTATENTVQIRGTKRLCRRYQPGPDYYAVTQSKREAA
jgi:hypothetical protein